MYQITVDKEFAKYINRVVLVKKDGNDMVAYDGTTEILRLQIPEDLKKSFDLIPEKRGYFGKLKDDYAKMAGVEDGTMCFTLLRFVDYHLHSMYSLLDGANKIEKIVEKSEGCNAITDHGAMFGVVDFFKKMDKAGKKSIIGIEVYCETKDSDKDSCHMILLVKNEQGWKNICKIISEAEVNFYRKPHVSYEMLEKYHEGLICTTACLAGEVAQNILDNKRDSALEVVEILQGIFGDDFYLEVQDHDIGSEEDIVNTAIFDIAEETGIKVVGAIDAHYPEIDDKFAHEVLLCIGTKKTISDPSRMQFDGNGYHIHTADEFEELFSYAPEIISNTFELADKCQFRFNLNARFMPKFNVPAPFTSEEAYFEHLCWEGFYERCPEGDPRRTSQEYIDRLNYEIELIKNTGFTGYFCIVHEYVNWAKENGIYVGPGRGSCVGSFACYNLKITELDPIPYGLLFERFINPERISPPDIDMDFEDGRRQEVVDHIRELYGDDHVSNIITFGTLAARQVIRDVARVLEVDLNFVNALCKSVPAEPKMTLKKAFDVSPDFKTYYETDDTAKKIIDIGMKLEGLSRQKSQHACGIIVANAPISDFVPEVLIQDKFDKTKKNRVAAFNMVELEELGLLKADFLGLRNMTIEKYAFESINERFFS